MTIKCLLKEGLFNYMIENIKHPKKKSYLILKYKKRLKRPINRHFKNKKAFDFNDYAKQFNQKKISLFCKILYCAHMHQKYYLHQA